LRSRRFASKLAFVSHCRTAFIVSAVELKQMARPARTALQASMRTGAPGCVDLDRDERRRLDSLAHRSRSAPALARRARIILACAEGGDSTVVARRLHVTPGTVCKWRGRFITHRLDGLYDEPRPSAKRTITDEQVEQVIIRSWKRRRSEPRTGVRARWRKPSGSVTRPSATFGTRLDCSHRTEVAPAHPRRILEQPDGL
jgi:transposase